MLGYQHFVAIFLALGALLTTATAAAAYTVQPGDTLQAISKKTGVPVARIAADNHLADPSRILAGQQLAVGQPSAAAPAPGAGAVYVVQPGDSLWLISRRAGVSAGQIAALNGIPATGILHVGQRLRLPGAPPPAAPAPAAPAPPAVHGEQARQLVAAAAREFGVDVSLALAVAASESSDNQGAVSPSGAVGLMQIEPSTAAWAGPALLGGRVDLTDARSNARLGAALLAYYLRAFRGDPRLALAAYYQGEAATRDRGILPGSRPYVDAVWNLRNRQAG